MVIKNMIVFTWGTLSPKPPARGVTPLDPHLR